MPGEDNLLLRKTWKSKPFGAYTDSMEKELTFHYLVRGVLIADGRVLVAREIGADNTFLPGGHIERGERAEAALVRELQEEIGLEPVVGQFLGAVEHVWPQDVRDNHEINLLFEIEIDRLNSNRPPESLEPHLEFLWVEPSRLADVNLQPFPLIDLFQQRAGTDHPFWASSHNLPA